MRIYYADETEHPRGVNFFGLSFQDKIFVFGGFSIPYGNILALKAAIEAVKNKYGIPTRLPLKWNFRDNSIKELYTSTLGKEQYSQIISKSDDVRDDILRIILDEKLDIWVLVCCSLKDLVPKKGKNFFTDCFVNFLQRVGYDLQLKRTDDAQIVIDTQPSERQDDIFSAFNNAYYDGVDQYGNRSHAGPLKGFNIYPSLLSASDLHSDEMQLADMIVGAIRDFLAWVKYGKDESKAKRYFPIIYKRLRSDEKNRFLDVGFVISNRGRDFPVLEQKIIDSCK